MKRILKAVLHAIALAVVAFVAGVFVYFRWSSQPEHLAARATGFELPRLTLIYRHEWEVPPFARKWFATWIFQLDEADGERLVACPFPGYRKNARDVWIDLDFLDASLKLPEENCYRYIDREPEYGRAASTTIVFTRRFLIIEHSAL